METFLNIPLEMEKVGDDILISDFRGDSLLWCYNLKNNSSKQFLPYGEGPQDFLPPVQYFCDNSKITVYNRWHYSLRYCTIDSLGVEVNRSVSVSTDIDMLYPLDETFWIASGRFIDSRFVILNGDGKIISHCGDYPCYMTGEESIPNFPKFMFHQSMFGYQKEMACLISVTGHVLELWNYHGKKLSLKQRKLLSPYVYQYKDGEYWASATPEPDVEKGVERIYCTDNNIYLLYNPNTHRQIFTKEDKLGSEVWIFDWNGKPKMKIMLDRKVICFCVDESEQNIYCIINNPDPTIGTFKCEL
jgi:hypothetical protein